MILPIGQCLGTTHHGTYEVRRGDMPEHLDDASFATWGFAHGPIDPVLTTGNTWTRDTLVDYAHLAGLADAADQVSGLVERGLLTETAATGPEALAFARAHRAVPLAVGLGNSPDQPEQYAIGQFGHALVRVDKLRYEVWCWSATYRSLWDVCEARATDPDSADTTSGAEPEEILRHVLTGIHQLASAGALYIDVVNP